MSHEEEAIAKVQAKAAESKGADGLKKHHTWTIVDMDERIFVFVLLLAFIGLIGIWTMATSHLVLYGSLVVVFLLLILWGVVRIKRIQNVREQRAEQAKSWKSEN